MRFVLLISLLAALSACRTVQTVMGIAPGPTAAALGLPSCPQPGLENWRQVRDLDFSFCIPSDWRRAAPRDQRATRSDSWTGRGDTLVWGAGPFLLSVPLEAPDYDYQPVVRGPKTVSIGGQLAALAISEHPPRPARVSVEWAGLRIAASTPQPHADLLLRIIYTVRFAADSVRRGA